MLNVRALSRVLVAPLIASTFVAVGAASAESFHVSPRQVADRKAVFATVESANVIAARARIGGTIASLLIDEGAAVRAGEVIAVVGDAKLALQLQSIDAQIAGLSAQRDQAETDLARAEDLFGRGTIPRARLDDAQTAVDVARNALAARQAERRVITQQRAEGEVIAPTAGRVLSVPVIAGAVIMAGEPIAMIAEADYVLRLRLPERHARFLAVGDPIETDIDVESGTPARFGQIVTVYPELVDGRVIADATVENLGDYFVGERIRVWVTTGSRTTIVVPAAYLSTRFGVDYATVTTDGTTLDVPVQRGQVLALPDMPDGVEVLSGLRADDSLVLP